MKTIQFFISFSVYCLVSMTSLYSQSTETDLVAKKEISKLAFVVGNWEGTGWMMGQDRNKHTFDQKEVVQFKLDSTVILIEGIGSSEGKVTHNALGILSYNKEENNYTLESHLSTGQSGKFKAELIENKLYWYPFEGMRYIVYRNDNDQWYEIGEMNRGGTWYQFFETTLDKK